MKRIFFAMFVLLLALVPSVAQVLPPPPAPGEARLPSGFEEAVYSSGFSNPTAMAFAPDGRLFVLEQGGSVRVVPAGGGSPFATPFHSFNVDSAGERGLLGIAFDPAFASNNFVYFYKTVPASGEDAPFNEVTRLTADPGNPNVSLGGSGVDIIQLEGLTSATNHNGGALHFGPDGKLYVAVGENANGSNAQLLTNRLGKLLRYNSDGSIPADNPFFDSAAGENRSIWALGLRNPFTFAIQPDTGKIHINDVGAGSWEEVNLGVQGGNYGWPDTEGMHSNPNYLNPVHVYANPPTGCAAISGGAFYNPPVMMFPAPYTGDYFFSDLCLNTLWVMEGSSDDVTIFTTVPGGSSVVDIDIGPDGALYYLKRGAGGQVMRVVYNAPPVEDELVFNGSFEIDGNDDRIPDGWTRSDGAKAKQRCDPALASHGSCVLRIKGAAVKGKVKQIINGAGIATGTMLTLSAVVTGANTAADAQIMLKLKTSAGVQKPALGIPDGTFPQQSPLAQTVTVDGAVLKLKVQVKYPAGEGKLFVDEVSVFASAPVR